MAQLSSRRHLDHQDDDVIEDGTNQALHAYGAITNYHHGVISMIEDGTNQALHAYGAITNLYNKLRAFKAR